MAPNRVERFLREAKLASRLDHPYAAHIYAFGAEPDGVLWIAMEHVRGSTLDELITARGAIPPANFGPLFGRLCEVVHTAHELGIIHRDIKGGNVMVIERAGQLLPKLLDFGIAKGDGEPLADRPDDIQLPDVLTGHAAELAGPVAGHRRSTRAPMSTRSACSRIAASPGTCRSAATSGSRSSTRICTCSRRRSPASRPSSPR